MALMPTFQWLYLPPILQWLLAATWPRGEVFSRFHIIWKFLEYYHKSTAWTWPPNIIIHVFVGQNKTISIWHQVQVFYQKKTKPISPGLRKCRCTCVHNFFLFFVKRENDWGPDHGSFTPHSDHLIWHQSNLSVFKLIPRQYLWHLQTYWQKHISKQQTLPGRRRMNNGGFVDTKISHALTLSRAQLHNVSWGGEQIFKQQKNHWSKKSTWRNITQ